MEHNYKEIEEDILIDLNDILGKGSHGKVCKGLNSKTKKTIAIKWIQARSKQLRQRQKKMLEILSQMNHTCILSYFGYSEKPEGIYFFLQYCSGGNLQKFKKQDVSEIKILYIFEQILQALKYLSQKNIIHRDLKPENILLNQSNRIKLADFGQARLFAFKMTPNIGTPIYQAPQVIFQPYQYDQRCDIWSTGLILYELLMKRQLFNPTQPLDSLKQMIRNFDNSKIQYGENIESEWIQMINFMLVYNFKERPTIQNVIDKYFELRPNIIKKMQQKSKISQKQQKLNKKEKIYLNILMNKSSIRSQQTCLETVINQLKLKNQLKQQRSYTNIINLNKYLRYYRQKIETHLILDSFFKQNEYKNLQNIYKFLLVFLSTGIYINKIQKHIMQLTNLKISMPNQSTLTIHNFIPKHQSQFKTILKKFKQYHEEKLKKSRENMQKLFIEKLYLKTIEQFKIECQLQHMEEFVKMVQKAQKKQFGTENQYLKLYFKCLNMNKVYLPQDKLERENIQKLKGYLFIRIIANLDIFFQDQYYQNDNYIAKKLYEIEQSKQQALIQHISKYN